MVLVDLDFLGVITGFISSSSFSNSDPDPDSEYSRLTTILYFVLLLGDIELTMGSQ